MADNDNKPICDLFDLDTLEPPMNAGERILYHRDAATWTARLVAGAFIVRCRELAGIDQEELANRLGLSLREVKRMESLDADGTPPSFVIMCTVARVCGVRLSITTEVRKPLKEAELHDRAARLQDALDKQFGPRDDG